MDFWGRLPFPSRGEHKQLRDGSAARPGCCTHLRVWKRCCQGGAAAAGPIPALLSSPRAGSQGCHPWGALGRQLRGLNPSSAFCRGVHNSRQPEPSCWRLFPRLGLPLGTMPASIPAPSQLLGFTACTGKGLTWGSDLLPAASGVPRCAHSPGLAHLPVPTHAHDTALLSPWCGHSRGIQASLRSEM